MYFFDRFIKVKRLDHVTVYPIFLICNIFKGHGGGRGFFLYVQQYPHLTLKTCRPCQYTHFLSPL